MIAENIVDFVYGENRQEDNSPHFEYLLNLVSKCAKIDVSYWFQMQEEPMPNKITKPQMAIISANTFINYMENNNACLRTENSQFWFYNGYFFAPLDNKSLCTILLTFIEKSLGLLFSESYFVDLMQKEIYNRAKKLSKSEQENKNSVLINFNNGVLKIDIKDYVTNFSFIERTPEHGFTYVLPYNYEPKNTHKPLFEKYISKVLPEQDLQDSIAEYIGYVLMGHNPMFKHEKALLLHGSGSNGKSVMFEIITALIGKDNVCNYSLRSLTDTTGYSRAQLAGKLLNYCTETGTRHNSDMLKALISGEPIEARLPYKDPFILKNYAKFIFNTNELPQVEHTDAFFRRLIIIPFSVKIKESEKDISLAQKIINNELPAIMNWVLCAMVRLIDQKRFTEAKKSRMALKAYKRENDSVLFFIAERYEKSNTAEQEAEHIYESYKQFCYAFNFGCVSYKTFLQRLKNAKLLKTKSRKKFVKVSPKIV